MLTLKEIYAVRKYSKNDYEDINTYLRSTIGKLKTITKYFDINKKIKYIDNALEKGKLSEPVIVYRRVSESQFGIKEGELRNKNESNKINQEAFLDISKKSR